MFPRTLTQINLAPSSFNGGKPEELVPEEVQVQSHAQFIDYLMAKDPRIQKDQLDFEGRNVVVFMLPPCLGMSSSLESPIKL